MSKQWGHGYCKGQDDANKKSKTLVGLWFHSLKGGEVEWQGRIDRAVHDGKYVVQLFSWISGDPTEKVVVCADDVEGWILYDDSSEMRTAWEKTL